VRIYFSLSNIIVLIVYLIAPAFITIFLRRNIKNWRKRAFKKRFSELIQDLSFRRKSSANFILIFCYRRLTAAIIIVMFASRNFTQIMLYIFCNQCVIIVLGTSNPF
jgi:hypothetical protein